MSFPALTLNLASGQVVAVTLSDPAQAQVLAAVVGEFAREKAKEEVMGRTYHMGEKRSEGLDYDDRLTVRLKCHHDTAYQYLGLPTKDGGLRSKRLGKKYLVTEQAVREFLGDSN